MLLHQRTSFRYIFHHHALLGLISRAYIFIPGDKSATRRISVIKYDRKILRK